MTDALSALNEEFYKLFWRLENNKKGMSHEQYVFMQEKLHAQYVREYNLLNYTEGAPLDKEIAAYKLDYDSQALDIEIRQKTAEQAAEIKRRRVIPAKTKRRFLFWHWHSKNYAMQLTEEAAEIDIDKYLDELELRIDSKPDGTAKAVYDLLKKSVPRPLSRRKRKAQDKQLHKLTQTLCRTLTRYHAKEQLEEMLAAADNEDNLHESPESSTPNAEPEPQPPEHSEPEQPDKPDEGQPNPPGPGTEEPEPKEHAAPDEEQLELELEPEESAEP